MSGITSNTASQLYGFFFKQTLQPKYGFYFSMKIWILAKNNLGAYTNQNGQRLSFLSLARILPKEGKLTRSIDGKGTRFQSRRNLLKKLGFTCTSNLNCFCQLFSPHEGPKSCPDMSKFYSKKKNKVLLFLSTLQDEKEVPFVQKGNFISLMLL